MSGVSSSVRLGVCVLSSAVLACASTSIETPASSIAAEIVRAEGLVRDGCYDCLLEARDALEVVATGAQRAALLPRLFGIQLVLIAREKELALDSTGAFLRAQTLASEVDGLEAARYLEIIENIAPDAGGTPQREMPRFSSDVREQVDRQIRWLRGAQDDAIGVDRDVRTYLALSLECGPGRLRAQRSESAVTGADSEESPLLVYRRAICGSSDGPSLRQVWGLVPRFVETTLFLGRLELFGVQRTGGRDARMLLDTAYARFPDSPAVTYVRGNLDRAIGDCSAAVGHYSETLALRSAHEGARLGRVICHTSLSQPEEAIADATVLIEDAAPNRGDAYYWRAWNRRMVGDLDAARADVDRGRTLLVNGQMLTLAGMIEHDQDDLDPAETDLRDAIRLDADNCTARAYLALVGVKRTEWLASAAQFVETADCYERAARFSEQEKAALMARQADPALEMDPRFVEQQLAGFDAAIADDRSQESRAALNAALTFFRGGDREQAGNYATRAARDPAREERVTELRRLLEDAAP